MKAFYILLTTVTWGLRLLDEYEEELATLPFAEKEYPVGGSQGYDNSFKTYHHGYRSRYTGYTDHRKRYDRRIKEEVVGTPVNDKLACQCEATWEFKGETYIGCDARSPKDTKPWCYIQGKSTCSGFAKESTVEPGKYWRHCRSLARMKKLRRKESATKKVKQLVRACRCKETWTFKGEEFSGCAKEGPEDDQPWCYVVDPDCPRAKQSKLEENESWRYCRVRENEMLKKLTANLPTPSCGCMTEWTWQRITYNGCEDPSRYKGQPWCYIDGDGTCPEAQRSKSRENMFWMHCGEAKKKKEPKGANLKSFLELPDNECTCKEAWEFEKQVYRGCDPAGPGKSVTWCYVEGTTCATAKPSTVSPGEFWRPCERNLASACECVEEWSYKGKKYSGCDSQAPDDTKPWCYITGGAACDARESKVNPGKWWKHCGEASDSADSEKEEKDKGDDTSEEDKGKDEANPPKPEETTPPAPESSAEDSSKTEETTEAGCECLSTWVWKDVEYFGCDTRVPEFHSPWCYVSKVGCSGAKESKVHSGLHWKMCSPGETPAIEKTEEASEPENPEPEVPEPGVPKVPELPAVKKQLTSLKEIEDEFLPEPASGELTKAEDAHMIAHFQPSSPLNPQPAAAQGLNMPAGGKCVCQSTWEYKGTTYTACDPRIPEHSDPWCFIEGTIDDCPDGDAYESVEVPGKVWKHCDATSAPDQTPATLPGPELGECECLPTWTWKDTNFHGCDPRGPDNEGPWCYIRGSSKCPTAKESKSHVGMWYRDCGRQTNSALQTQENCACKEEWMWEGQTYQFCDSQKPDSPVPWCYIPGDTSTCPDAKESEINPGQFWKECGETAASPVVPPPVPTSPLPPVVPEVTTPAFHTNPALPGEYSAGCECKAKWEWKAAMYQSCDPRKPDTPHTWCFVVGECTVAKESTHYQGQYWRNCHSEDTFLAADGATSPSSIPVIPPGPIEAGCACKETWEWKDAEYQACDARKPDTPHTWCFVVGTCTVAKESVHYSGQFWRNCLPTDVVAGASSAASNPDVAEQLPAVSTPPGSDFPKVSVTTPPLPAVATPQVPSSATALTEGCACKAQWMWKETEYQACDSRKPDTPHTWCFVVGTCVGAKESEHYPGEFWRNCDPEDMQHVAGAAVVPATPATVLTQGCACKAQWMWKETEYQACDARKPDTPHTWCFVVGTCVGAKKSAHFPGEFWRNCDPGDMQHVAGAAVVPATPAVTTPIPLTEGCECKAEWAWKEETYQLCDPRKPDTPHTWCFVEGTCTAAKESEHYPGEFWRQCSADEVVPSTLSGVPAKVAPAEEAGCLCKPEWQWKEQIYHDCDERKPDTPHAWCFISGTCSSAKESTHYPGQFWRQCGADVDLKCKCKTEWMWDDLPHYGCDPRAPDHETTWCMVDGDETCPDVKISKKVPGAVWKDCKPEVDVKPQTNLDTTQPTNCECMDEWMWKGSKYHGCDSQKPDNQNPWCYVVNAGDQTCEGVKESTVVPGMFWKECAGGAAATQTVPESSETIPASSCDCLPTWEWDQSIFKGCDPTAPDNPEPWCFLSDGAACDGAIESAVFPGKFWKTCTPEGGMPPPVEPIGTCKCLQMWQFKEENYMLCDHRKPDHEKPWCYIDGNLGCPGAQVSQMNPGLIWKECLAEDEMPKEPVTPAPTEAAKPEVSCLCQAEWEYKGEMYTGCDPAKPENPVEWCYIEGDRTCPGSQESKLKPGTFWIDCGTPVVPEGEGGTSVQVSTKKSSTHSCECLPTWEYKGIVFHNCDARTGEAETPWCYIDGGKNCEGAMLGDAYKPDRYMKHCDNPVMPPGVENQVIPNPMEEQPPITPAPELPAPVVPVLPEVPEVPPPATQLPPPIAPETILQASCDCLPTWEWNGSAFHGCDSRADPRVTSVNIPWCIVGAGCADAVEDGNHKWRYCDPCDCKSSWRFEDMLYEHCDDEAPGKEEPWCFVDNEHHKCEQARESVEQPGEYWRMCDACECQTAWVFEHKTYNKCDIRKPGKDEPWCIVKGNLCEEANPTPNPEFFWRNCKPQQTPPSPVNPEVEYPSEENEVVPPSEPELPAIPQTEIEPLEPVKKETEEVKEETEEVKQPAADACECKASWLWKEETYSGCDPSKPEAEKNWCYVNGGTTCPSAEASKHAEGLAWRYCDINEAPQTLPVVVQAKPEEEATPPIEPPQPQPIPPASGTCPGAEKESSTDLGSLDTVSFECFYYGELEDFCFAVQKLFRKLASAGKIKMVDLAGTGPTMYHSACKRKDAGPNWWEDDNRPMKKSRSECLQPSSCVATRGDRGPKFIQKTELCNGKGVQFKYNVVETSKTQKVLEFMDRADFAPLKAAFLASQTQLEASYSKELIDEHVRKSFADSQNIHGETVKLVMDIFQIPGYYASEANEVCMANTLLTTSLKSGQMIYEDDHIVQSTAADASGGSSPQVGPK